MAKNFKKGLSLALAAIMCAGTMSTTALAETTLENGNIWYGDEVKINVAEGKDSYTYMLFGDIPNFYYYETSNHTVKKEATGGGAVHMIALIDTVANHGEWTPSGVYESIINIDETKRILPLGHLCRCHCSSFHCNRHRVQRFCVPSALHSQCERLQQHPDLHAADPVASLSFLPPHSLHCVVVTGHSSLASRI